MWFLSSTSLKFFPLNRGSRRKKESKMNECHLLAQFSFVFFICRMAMSCYLFGHFLYHLQFSFVIKCCSVIYLIIYEKCHAIEMAGKEKKRERNKGWDRNGKMHKKWRMEIGTGRKENSTQRIWKSVHTIGRTIMVIFHICSIGMSMASLASSACSNDRQRHYFLMDQSVRM